MNQNTYPKTFTHRTNIHATVVVANAEQEAQLPDEYRPAVTGASGTIVAAADHATDVMLTPEYAQLLADREALETARAEFAEHEARTRKELEDTAQALRTDRNNLVAGYTADKQKLDEDRARLDNEMAEWAKTKAGEPPADAAAVDQATSAPAPATTGATAGPAKRVRTAKGE